MTITAHLTHNHQTGTLLDIEDLRPHPNAKAAVKAAGFRWSPTIGWYRPKSRNKNLTEHDAATIRTTLLAAGITINLDINNEPQDFTHALDAKTNQAATHRQQPSDLANGIALGQPVLVGHHSAPQHTRHLAKIRNELEKATETSTTATATRRRVAAATRTADTSHDGTFLVNRILEASRNNDHDTVTQIVQYMAKHGFTFVDPATLAPGQRWHVRRSYVEIVRVNTKTATVRAIYPNGDPVFPESITNRIDLRYFHYATSDREAARQLNANT